MAGAAQTLRELHQCRRGTAESRAGSSFALSTAQRESQRPQGVRTRTPEDRSRAVVGASDTQAHSVRKCTQRAGIASLRCADADRAARACRLRAAFVTTSNFQSGTSSSFPFSIHFELAQRHSAVTAVEGKTPYYFSNSIDCMKCPPTKVMALSFLLILHTEAKIPT